MPVLCTGYLECVVIQRQDETERLLLYPLSLSYSAADALIQCTPPDAANIL